MRERKKAGKKEREITVLTLLVEALSHLSQSHSLSLSLSSNHHPFIPPSTIMKKRQYSASFHSHSGKKPKLDLLQGTKKRTVLFFFLQNVKLVLYGSLRIHATDVVLHVMQVLPSYSTTSYLLQYYYYSTYYKVRYLR